MKKERKKEGRGTAVTLSIQLMKSQAKKNLMHNTATGEKKKYNSLIKRFRSNSENRHMKWTAVLIESWYVVFTFGIRQFC